MLTAFIVVTSVFGAFLSVGFQTPADAGSAKQMCLAASGTISQKTKCASNEKLVAPGKLITTTIPTRSIKNGKVKMQKAGLSSTAGYAQSVSGLIVETTDIATNGVVAVTEKLSIPRNWNGTYSGTCPTYAPIPIGWGMWSPELGNYTSLPFNFGVGVPLANFTDSHAENAPFTVYVTQSCAPIIDYQPAP